MISAGRRASVFSALCIMMLKGPVLQGAEKAASSVPLEKRASGAERWLQGQVTPNRLIPAPDPTRRKLLVSYDVSPQKSPRGYHRSATYDNALAALAFLVAGDSDSAAFTLHAVARLVRADGSLWVGYNTANNWPDESEHDGAMIRAGAVGWAGYALTTYLAMAPSCGMDRSCAREQAFFLDSAHRLAGYLVSLQVNSPGDPRDGLLRLGYGSTTLVYRPETNQVDEVFHDGPALGVSTENNISAWFFLRQLAALVGEARWREPSDRVARALMGKVWNASLGQFNQGFDSDGAADTSKALDCASWGALFLMAQGERTKASRALSVIDGVYGTRSGTVEGFRPYADKPVYTDEQVGKFFFPDNPRKQWQELPVVWSEGTLGVALACLRLGDVARARRLVAGLAGLEGKNGGLRYASLDVPHIMADTPNVGATAWRVFVTEALAGNHRAEQIWK